MKKPPRIDDQPLDTDFDSLNYGAKTSVMTTVATDHSAYVEPPRDPERRLMIACLLQAMEDATMPEERAMARVDNRVIRDEARAFIFAPFGTTATWFRDVCDIAGYDANYVRRKVKDKIEEGTQIRFDYTSVRGDDE